jgi:hypothetical protein
MIRKTEYGNQSDRAHGRTISQYESLAPSADIFFGLRRARGIAPARPAITRTQASFDTRAKARRRHRAGARARQAKGITSASKTHLGLLFLTLDHGEPIIEKSIGGEEMHHAAATLFSLGQGQTLKPVFGDNVLVL